MTMTSTNPYADAYAQYWAAGWRGVLPLPYQKKTHPPTGYTGRNAAEPSYADCAAWAEGTAANIALHLPPGVIGVDVDDYAGKGGGATLHQLVEECGVLPPTWMSTSRGDGISGIRLYRVPVGVELVSALSGGIEIIQAHHRYVVCWPSVHPEGRTYEWINEATGAAEIPPLDALPDLPRAWIDRLSAAATGGHAKAPVAPQDVLEFVNGLPDGEPCQHVLRAAGMALSGESRHDSYNHATLAVLGRGRQGCPGARTALARMQKAFIAEIAAPGERATEAEATQEWARNLFGAVAILIAEHPEQGAGCPDDYVAELLLAEQRQNAAESDENAPVADEGAAWAYQQQVARKAAEMKLVDDAREMLAAAKAGEAPPLGGFSLTDFLAQPDNPVAYRIDGLWPMGGRVLLPAAAKAGKTTLVTNLLRSLADGHDFLGQFATAPADRRIVYLNMEVGPDQMRSWLRRVHIENTAAVWVENLRGKASALTLGSDKGRRRIADWLASLDAQIVILDPIAPLLGALGLDENSNSDVATFFSWWSETLYMAEVEDDFLAHHAGWNGARSRGASRLVDEPDAIWTISRDEATDEDGDDIYGVQEPRFIKAIGRDVELNEHRLILDHTTGLVTITEGNRKESRDESKMARAKARVLSAIAAGNRSQRSIIKASGNESDNKKALEALVNEGRLWVEKAAGAYLYSQVSPSVASVAGDTATVGVAASIEATPTARQAAGVCEDCSGDTGSPGFRLCATCEQKRRNGR